MWLANMEWKRPPDFGRTQKNGLYKYVDAAITNEVFGPWSWIVKNIVLKQYTLFGWSTLLIESALAALLLLGLWTRLAALVGAAISVTIALSVLHYPRVAVVVLPDDRVAPDPVRHERRTSPRP